MPPARARSDLARRATAWSASAVLMPLAGELSPDHAALADEVAHLPTIAEETPMTLTPTRTLLDEARAAGRGIGAFNVVHLETAEALAGAAEDAGLPVILQLSENCVRYHGGFDPIALATLAVAEASSARVAVHLDHAEDPELALRAIDRGFGSVMYDGAKLDFADERGDDPAAWSSGRMPRACSSRPSSARSAARTAPTRPGVRTDPDEAARFVAETGVGALAVAVGSSHAMTERVAAIDLELVARLARGGARCRSCCTARRGCPTRRSCAASARASRRSTCRPT